MTDDRENITLDLRGVMCPLNFVKTKLALDEMRDGQILDLVLDDNEAMQNVPRSVKEEGHRIVSVREQENGSYVLSIRKGG